ncbi:hypothetical protein PENANT_c022G01249 [Penicillium antarcticum]|uniref:Uncharacterized protein n=1 Tax=Penicillium antarcticum TaxID=416450 RepID=A0A1V6PZH6_9EURO|nr:uncharacterized protein N7508_002790 [Penicillium antarcticum]KAJ5311960.1 hypothetical protein N7508_002790 [Penicillium antarcticum]OQD82363.1 hypothetical protein PENANT_c022G01249 [Penicillium antarcticum]
MSTEQPIPDHPALGESWVIASSIKERETKEKASVTPSQSPRKNSKSKIEQSSESSWISGPELIMPSICEAPNPEKSWVEYKRSPNQSATPNTKKRRKLSMPSGHAVQDRNSIKAGDAGPSTPATENTPAKIKVRLMDSTLLRGSINAVLIALILHMLVLPELVYQAKDLCQLPSIKALYPSSCINLEPTYPPRIPFQPTASPEDSLTTSQRQLELIFDTTLETLTPLSGILKQSESMLSDLEAQLKTTFPDAKNALDLEFQGSTSAMQAAVWEFDSLRADLRSAIDSLLATRPTEPTAGTVASDTRLAIQTRRREEYLDRLRSQIRSKADSLNTRFTTLDDHLEAVDGIVTREERRNPSRVINQEPSPGDRLHSVLDSLDLGTIGSYFFRARSSGAVSSSSAPAQVPADESTTESTSPRPAATLALLRVAATHHRPVAGSVLRLARQLRDVQRAGFGSTY